MAGVNALSGANGPPAHPAAPQSVYMPAAARMPTLEHDDEHDASDEDGFAEGYAESLGVSIGREQSRLMSPTTPAAEKSAAFDQMNSWGFFDGEDEATQAEVLRNTLQNTVLSEADQDGVAPGGADQHHAQIRSPSQLPSPWRANQKAYFQPDVSAPMQSRRPRARTASALADLGLKKFLSNLSFPSLPEPWTPRQRVFVSAGSAHKDLEASQKRHGRSNSRILANLPWSLPYRSSSQSRDVSPKQKGPSPEAGTHQRNRSDGTQRPTANGTMSLPRSSSTLRRAASVDSLLRPSLSRQVTLETLGDDITQWEHVNQQVNSRAKAIRDTFQDSLPQMPAINFSSFRPDNALRTLREPFTRSMSTVFRNEPNASEPSSRNSSPSKYSPTRPVKSRFPSLDAALEQLEGDIVVMGGYRGSVLRAAEPPHRQLWVPVKVGLNIRKVDLEVGLNREDEENMEQTIFASGMLSHIGPIDVSRRLFKRLRHCRNAQEGKLRVWDYGYDWRLSPALLSRRLISFLEGLECNSSKIPKQQRGAVVLSHSLGGLITRHAVNKRPELFAGVTYVGTPQHCVNILGPLRNGDEVLLSSKVLTAQVNFTFRTSFLLLPENGRCFINKQTKEQYDVDFFDVESWKRYAFSPCIASCLPSYHTPERKSLFGSLSSSIPSLLPLNNSFSMASNDSLSAAEESAAAKAENVMHPAEGTVGVKMSSPPLSTSVRRRSVPETHARGDLAVQEGDAARRSAAGSEQIPTTRADVRDLLANGVWCRSGQPRCHLPRGCLRRPGIRQRRRSGAGAGGHAPTGLQGRGWRTGADGARARRDARRPGGGRKVPACCPEGTRQGRGTAGGGMRTRAEERMKRSRSRERL